MGILKLDNLDFSQWVLDSRETGISGYLLIDGHFEKMLITSLGDEKLVCTLGNASIMRGESQNQVQISYLVRISKDRKEHTYSDTYNKNKLVFLEQIKVFFEKLIDHTLSCIATDSRLPSSAYFGSLTDPDLMKIKKQYVSDSELFELVDGPDNSRDNNVQRLMVAEPESSMQAASAMERLTLSK